MVTELTAEMFAGNFLNEAPRVITQDGRKHRAVYLKCKHCRETFTALLSNAKRTQQQCCSKVCYARLTEHFTGGNERHPLYATWLSMRQRCLYPQSANYAAYGARGISIADDLLEFKDYAEYVMGLANYDKLQKPNYSIDRIDNNGNYEKGNLRIVSGSIQVINQRSQPSKTGVVGVSLTRSNTYLAEIKYKHKRVFKKVFKTLDEAITARNNFILENNLPHLLSRKPKELL